MLHPDDMLAIEVLLEGDMDHAVGGRGAVPMFLARRDPDRVASPDLSDRASPGLSETRSGQDDERLAKRMGVPRRSGARLEGDAVAPDPGWRGSIHDRVLPD